MQYGYTNMRGNFIDIKPEISCCLLRAEAERLARDFMFRPMTTKAPTTGVSRDIGMRGIKEFGVGVLGDVAAPDVAEGETVE
jgi:hypothetical protein